MSENKKGAPSLNDFDHPCRETCSGWQQGYARGKAEVADSAVQLLMKPCVDHSKVTFAEVKAAYVCNLCLKAENERLRIQMAEEREVALDAAEKGLDEARKGAEELAKAIDKYWHSTGGLHHNLCEQATPIDCECGVRDLRTALENYRKRETK